LDTKLDTITLVLREKSDAKINSDYLNQNGINSKPFPITTLNYKSYYNSEILKKRYTYLIITSPKAIKVANDLVLKTENGLLRSSRVFSIGMETTKKLNEIGFVNILTANNNSKSLSDLVIQKTIKDDYGLWIAARDRNVDLKLMLKEKNRNIEILEGYKTEPISILSKYTINYLKTYRRINLIIFSSRNVLIAKEILENYNLFEEVNNKSILFVNSNNVALKAKEIGWLNIKIIKKNFTKDILNHIIDLSK
jgi:uroporphyrinogen-III synthase